MKPKYSDLPMETGAKKSGLVSVRVAPRDWLVTYPLIDFNTGKATSAVLLEEGMQWLTLEFTEPSYLYDESPKSNKSGDFYEITISGSLNNYDADVQQVLETLRYYELVAIVMDRKKRMRLVGNGEVGLKLSPPSKKIQNTSGGQEIIQIQMLMDSEDTPPFYDV